MGASINVNSETSLIDLSTNFLTLSTGTNVSTFPELYQSFVESETISTRSITFNGTTVTMVELPQESFAVLLPDNRIGLRYSDEEASILPNGSNITLFENKPVIVLPENRDVISVSKFVVSPVEGFLTTAHFTQSIEQLDTYSVTVVFPGLSHPNPDASMVLYSIDWGDGTKTSYTANNITATHVYRSSNTYDIKVNASDDLGFTYEIRNPYTVKYEGSLMHSYFWVDKNKEPVAVTTSAGAGLVTLGVIALTETGKYKLLIFLTLLFPLYTRISKEDVLDQFVRGQIYGFIKTNPGVHYNQIRRQVGVKNGTLSYHLGVLEKTELIHSRREGLKYRAFYPSGMMFPQAQRFRLTELQIKIIAVVKQHPGINQKDIARRLNQKPQTINYNVKVLDQANLIKVLRDGRKTGCYATDDAIDASFA